MPKPWWPTIRLLRQDAPAGAALEVWATSRPTSYLLKLRDSEHAEVQELTLEAAPRLSGWDVVRAQLDLEGSERRKEKGARRRPGGSSGYTTADV